MQVKQKTLLKLSAVFVLFLAVFYPIYRFLYERFSAKESYYSHGFLIPFVFAYLVWRKRSKLQAIEPKPSLAGLIILLAGVLLHIVSLALKVNTTSYMSIPVVLFGIVLYLGGWKMAKELLFPIGFLIFMLPLPGAVVIVISFKLKMIAAHAATAVGKFIGIKAQRVGSIIYYPGGRLLVGEPCSGLRSLITFLALGTLFTQFTNAAAWKKWLMFLCTVPIALASNIVRLTFLLVVSYVYGEKVALGFLHDFSGFMVFVLGFLGFIALSKLLKCQVTIGTI